MNIDEFYAENPARKRSGESDYGVWWTDNGRHFPQYRVSYVQATGEVYTVQLVHRGTVEVLGVVPPDGDGLYYQTLDRILDGWAEKCHEPNSLPWVREKLAAHDGR